MMGFSAARVRTLVGIAGVVIGCLAVPADAAAAPSGPGNVRLTEVSASGATLTWSPPVDTRGLYGYNIVDLGNPAVNNAVGFSFTTTGQARLEPSRTYRLAVSATYVDRTFGESRPSAAVTFTTPRDTTAPGTPTAALLDQSATSVTLRWMSGGDDVGVETFVLSNGERSWEFPAWQQWWGSLTGLQTNRTHTIVVRARDAAGNLSAASAPVSAAIENRPPTAPANLRVANGQLAWDPATDDSGRVPGYSVLVDGGFHTATLTTSAPLQIFDDSFMEFLPPPGTHSYVVHARDPSGNLSAASAPLTVAVP